MALSGVGEGLHKAMENVFKSFEQGAALEHLSRRTGESAGNLYRLQEAIKACGGSVESLPMMLFQMQKALGGVSEMGESTADVFHKLRLNVGELKKAGPAEALAQIMERMGTLSPDSAAKASSMIFGRMGAGAALQMSRSPAEFKEAFAESARVAEIFQRAQGAFAQIGRTILSIKREFTGFWAGFAEGAAPAMQRVLDWLKKIDLTSIGVRIGKLFERLAEEFRTGHFSDLLGLSLEAGFEQGEFYAARFVATLGAGLAAAVPAAIAAGFNASAGLLTPEGGGFFAWTSRKAIKLDQEAKARIEKDPTLTPAERARRIKAEDDRIEAEEVYQNDLTAGTRQARAERAKKAAADIQQAVTEGMKSASETWGNFGAAPHEAMDRLRANLGSMMGRLGAAFNGRPLGKDDANFGGGLVHRTEGNVFEKMGFVMGGTGGPMHDTALNTARLVDLVVTIRDRLIDYKPPDATEPLNHAVV